MVGYFTIAHTGTQYWRLHHFGEPGERWKDLDKASEGDVAFAHCNLRHEQVIKDFSREIVTTWRDPLQVAVSWYARGKLDRGYEPWRHAWRVWAEHVKPRASKILRMDEAISEPINSMQHNSLAHYLFRNNRLDELFQLIDVNEVLWAETQCQ
jgi:hypothetical protein